jgi:hypothetical protein
MKKQKSIVDSLSSSLVAESAAVDKRFEKADQFFKQEQQPAEVEEQPQKKKDGVGEGSVKNAVQPKPKKAVETEKVIRDAFSMPVADQQLIQDIKIRGIKLGLGVNKSEIVRAGLRALMELPDAKLTALLNSVPKIKVGRPGEK